MKQFSELDTGPRGLGSSPGLGHCVVFLGKIGNGKMRDHGNEVGTLSASLHPGVQMSTGNTMLGITYDGQASHPGRE